MREVDVDVEIEGKKHNLDNLSEWEQGFMKSISHQLENGKELSEKQLSKINQIVDERGSSSNLLWKIVKAVFWGSLIYYFFF